MKITKNDIRQAILEALDENPQTTETPPPTEKGDVNSAEQGIAAQINQFILDLAAQPGLDLNTKRPIIQKVFNILQTRLKSEPAGLDVKKNRARMTGQSAGTAAKAAAVDASKLQEEGCGDHVQTQEPQMHQDLPTQHHQSHDESDMAKSQLHRASEYAAELEQMIHDGEDLEAWVQAKITKAADYLSSVKHYLQYNKMKGDH
jgi:hypothetical protein